MFPMRLNIKFIMVRKDNSPKDSYGD